MVLDELNFIDKIQLMNTLIQINRFNSYLEIGFFEGSTFKEIRCNTKVAVDPAPRVEDPCLLKMTSDEFFAKNTAQFDIIHIDGLHESTQILRDIENALKVLSPNGFIVVHDMLPWEEYLQEPTPQEGRWWTGDGWKAFVHLRQTRTDLSMFTIPIDCGLGIIRPGNQKLYKLPVDNYKDFVIRKKNAMNIKKPTLADLVIHKEAFYREVVQADLSLDSVARGRLLIKLGLDKRKELIWI